MQDSSESRRLGYRADGQDRADIRHPPLRVGQCLHGNRQIDLIHGGDVVANPRKLDREWQLVLRNRVGEGEFHQLAAIRLRQASRECKHLGRSCAIDLVEIEGAGGGGSDEAGTRRRKGQRRRVLTVEIEVVGDVRLAVIKVYATAIPPIDELIERLPITAVRKSRRRQPCIERKPDLRGAVGRDAGFSIDVYPGNLGTLVGPSVSFGLRDLEPALQPFVRTQSLRSSFDDHPQRAGGVVEYPDPLAWDFVDVGGGVRVVGEVWAHVAHDGLSWACRKWLCTAYAAESQQQQAGENRAHRILPIVNPNSLDGPRHGKPDRTHTSHSNASLRRADGGAPASPHGQLVATSAAGIARPPHTHHANSAAETRSMPLFVSQHSVSSMVARYSRMSGNRPSTSDQRYLLPASRPFFLHSATANQSHRPAWRMILWR